MRRYWVWGGAGVLVLAVVAVIVWWPKKDGGLPDPRARVYADFSACLLTGPQGLAAPGVGPVWAGMQGASAATSAKVSFLAVSGPDTEANWLPYLNSLVQRRCDVVITVGEPGNAVAAGQAGAHPKVRFVMVGGGRSAGNVTTAVTGDDVRRAVEAAAHDTGY